MSKCDQSSLFYLLTTLKEESKQIFSFRYIVYHLVGLYIFFKMFKIIENSNINIALFYWFIILYVCIYYFFISYIILKS